MWHSLLDILTGPKVKSGKQYKIKNSNPYWISGNVSGNYWKHRMQTPKTKPNCMQTLSRTKDCVLKIKKMHKLWILHLCLQKYAKLVSFATSCEKYDYDTAFKRYTLKGRSTRLPPVAGVILGK